MASFSSTTSSPFQNTSSFRALFTIVSGSSLRFKRFSDKEYHCKLIGQLNRKRGKFKQQQSAQKAATKYYSMQRIEACKYV